MIPLDEALKAKYQIPSAPINSDTPGKPAPMVQEEPTSNVIQQNGDRITPLLSDNERIQENSRSLQRTVNFVVKSPGYTLIHSFKKLLTAPQL